MARPGRLERPAVRAQGTVHGRRIVWEPEGAGVDKLRVDVEADGTGGKSLRKWMPAGTETIIIEIKPAHSTGAGQGTGAGHKRQRRRGGGPAQASAPGKGRTPSSVKGTGTTAGQSDGVAQGKAGGSTAEQGGVDGAGLRKTPEGYTWHHHQDGTTMQLVPQDLHSEVRHTGGRAHYKHRTGDETVYRN